MLRVPWLIFASFPEHLLPDFVGYEESRLRDELLHRRFRGCQHSLAFRPYDQAECSGALQSQFPGRVPAIRFV